MGEYFSMGGYAAFVWSAYGMTVFVMLALVIATCLDIAIQKKRLDALESNGARKRAPARPSAQTASEQ
ncbi:MAG: heme exporter protein CcmD [Pseudomonadota bacterium]